MHGKIPLVFIGFLAATPWIAAADEPSSRQAEPLARYQAMIERSPFVLATETAPPAPVVPENQGFTKDLVLTGAVRMESGEYITVSSRDLTQRFSLGTGETYNDIALVSVAWSDAVGKTKATLKKGAEYGTIAFDEAAARAGAVAGAPAGNGPPPGTMPGQGGGPPPPPPGMAGRNEGLTPASPGPNPRNVIRRRPISTTPRMP